MDKIINFTMDRFAMEFVSKLVEENRI